MKNDNIIIISHNKSLASKIANKINLLRSVDSLGFLDYEHIDNILSYKVPELLLMITFGYEDLTYIYKIRSYEKFKNTSIIMITNNFESDFLCKAFDIGIDDFIELSSDETVLLMRIMWALKNKIKKDSLMKKSEVLAFMDITDKETGFYQKIHTQEIFDREYKNILTHYDKAVFMIMSADIQCKSEVSVYQLAKLLKDFVRINDIVGFAPDNKIYLLLNQSEEKGAKNIFDRVNNALPFDCSISASAMNIALVDNFKDAERLLNNSLDKALENVNSFIFEKNIVQNDTDIDLFMNNANNFKGNYIKQIEKIVSPTFFKMKSIYEPKFFNTEIVQIISNQKSSFIIKNKEVTSSINITYPKYSDIVVEVNDACIEKSECDKIIVDIKDFTSEFLENIIQSLAENFRKMLYKSEE